MRFGSFATSRNALRNLSTRRYVVPDRGYLEIRLVQKDLTSLHVHDLLQCLNQYYTGDLSLTVNRCLRYLSAPRRIKGDLRTRPHYFHTCKLTLLLSIYSSGKDTKKFLQGVCTNDTSKLKKHGDCIAAAFLTPKVR